MRLELGYGLLALTGDGRGAHLPDQIKALPRQLAGERGFVLRPVRIQDDIQLPADTYVIRIREIEAGRGQVRPGMILLMAPQGGTIGLPGEESVEPTFGPPARWAVEALGEEASLQGLTMVDPATVVTTQLTELVKESLRDMLSSPRPSGCSATWRGLSKAHRRHRARPHHHGRHPAGAPGAARRAGVDPRSGPHRRGHRRGGRPLAEHPRRDRACASTAWPAR